MRTALFCDTESLYRDLKSRYNKRLDYRLYLSYLVAQFGYDVTIRYAYGNQKSSVVHKFITLLNSLGFTTNFKYGKDWHVELILNAVSVVDKIDAVVLGTSDPVYRPLIPWLEAHGVKVHVVASNIPSALSEIALCQEIGKDLLDASTFDPTE